MAQILARGLGQRLRKGAPKRREPGFPAINLLPPAYRPAPLMTLERVMAILVVLELFAAVLLFRTYGESTLATLRKVTGREDARSPEVVQADRLRQQINGLRGRITTVEAAKRDLRATSPDWPELLDRIFNQGPRGVSISSLREIAGDATIAGSAATAADMTEYRNLLLNTEGVQSAQVQTIGREPGTDRVTFTFQVKLVGGGRK